MSYYDREEELKKTRNVKYNIHPLFTKRWSPRGYKGDPISQEALAAVIEAGRLSPSCSNSQPWRIIYAHRETEDWDVLFDLLLPGNQSWVKNSGALMLIVSKIVDDNGKTWGYNSFDSGAFWCSMALESVNQGIPMHGIGGFDHEKAAEVFKLGDDYKVEVMCAIGLVGDLENLNDRQKAMERPNSRKELSEIMVKANQASKILA